MRAVKRSACGFETGELRVSDALPPHPHATGRNSDLMLIAGQVKSRVWTYQVSIQALAEPIPEGLWRLHGVSALIHTGARSSPASGSTSLTSSSICVR